MLSVNLCCDKEKGKRKLLSQTQKIVQASIEVHSYCLCLIVEESEAHVAVLWFGDGDSLYQDAAARLHTSNLLSRCPL